MADVFGPTINSLNNRQEDYQNIVAQVDEQFNQLTYNSTDIIRIDWDGSANHGHLTRYDASNTTMKSWSEALTKSEFDYIVKFYDTTTGEKNPTKGADGRITKAEWSAGTAAVRKDNKLVSTCMQFFIDILDKLTTLLDTAAK